MKIPILILAFPVLFTLGGMMVLFENPLGPYLILVSSGIGYWTLTRLDKKTLPY